MATRQPGTAASATRGRGAERSEDIRRVVLDLVAARGIEGVTVDAIAAAAKTSKATLYRRWPTKTDLIREAIQMSFGDEQPRDPGDLHSLRAELRVILQGAAAMLRDNRRLIIALIDGAQRDAEVFRLMKQETRDNPREATQRPMMRAIARGEVGPDVSLSLVTDVALPIMHHRAIWDEPIDDDFLDRLLDEVLMPLTTVSTTGVVTGPAPAGADD